jgi:glucose/arabinose dehydrogenase
MSNSNWLAQAVALVGQGALTVRRLRDGEPPQAVGSTPAIPEARPQGKLPTLKMPTAQGWAEGQTPVAAPGLKVRAFATDLVHPRWLHVLPNGDVTVAEALFQPGPVRNLFGHAMVATMRRAGAVGDSPNRITLLRDRNGDGVAEERWPLLEGLRQPFGMALVGNVFYVGNTDGVVAYPYTNGTTRITAPERRLTTFKSGGHWTRSLLASPDGQRLYAGVGSLSNIADMGMDVEEGRACIVELNLVDGTHRTFASGLRNPVGMAWEPQTARLWTVVNERDGLGDETPPDYLTSVQDGGFYGWPYCYWGQTVDERVPQEPAAVARALQPSYALGGHTASLGLCWLPAGTLPGFPAGMVIGQHGSWNRSTLSGYRVVLVPFENGQPSGPPRDILSGFLAPDEKVSYGRPVGVAVAADGALLVADDVGDVVWRVTGA